MIREVYIDSKQVDVRPDSEVGYMFTSPIFRDITKIVSNRTTTYKIPKTSNNLTVFGLSNNPEIISDFPYNIHRFREFRDGLLFIDGICTLIKSSEKDIEISVVWGTTTMLTSLKDLKLRDIKIGRDNNYVDWGGSFSGFLESDSTAPYGFIKIDYGKGLGSLEFMRPAITTQGILNLIREDSGVSIIYPDRFTDIFKGAWIPLLSKNANEITWNNNGYSISAKITVGRRLIVGLPGKSPNLESSHDTKGIIDGLGFIRWSGEGYSLHSKTNFTVEGTSLIVSDFDMKLSFCRVDSSSSLVRYIDTVQEQTVSKSTDGYYHFNMDTLSPDYSEDTYFAYVFSRVDYKGDPIKDESFGINIINEDIKLTVRTKEVQFGEDYPIIPNLPDISVLDFLKSIMQMYGLFAYYDYRKYGSTATIEFLSIDDIYTKYLPKAYDWTNKIIPKGRTRMEVSYTYSDYAQINHFKYKEDSTVPLNVDGELKVDNTTLKEEKDLIELPFAPSVNSSDGNGVFASIKLYNSDGSLNQVEDRILWRDERSPYFVGGKEYITAKFDESLHIKGDKGLLNTYYKAYKKSSTALLLLSLTPA